MLVQLDKGVEQELGFASTQQHTGKRQLVEVMGDRRLWKIELFMDARDVYLLNRTAPPLPPVLPEV
jgi:hypothetical protein